MDPKMIDDLARRLADAAPEGLKTVKEDAEQNFKALLQSALGKLDLVTREDYEVQKGVLARTREKLEQLEQRIADMEEAARD